MFHTFPISDKVNSCCFDDMMERFDQNKEEYCKAKFMSYVVDSTQLKSIISVCNELNGPKSNTVVLVSFRDPETRTLAYINDMCRKNDNRRIFKACKLCEYNDNTKDTFDYFTSNTNQVFQHILDTTNINIKNVNVMAFEMEDIERMFSLLGMRYPSFNLLENDDSKKKEVTEQVCDFGFNSRLMKQLGQSNRIYRQLIGDRLQVD